MFSSALQSGQLGPLMSQFGFNQEVVDAAAKGGESHHSCSLSDKYMQARIHHLIRIWGMAQLKLYALILMGISSSTYAVVSKTFGHLTCSLALDAGALGTYQTTGQMNY